MAALTQRPESPRSPVTRTANAIVAMLKFAPAMRGLVHSGKPTAMSQNGIQEQEKQTVIQNFISLVTRHWISMLGSVIALGVAVLMILLFGMELSGFRGGPYLGILTYLLLPMMFVFGLALIPVGVIRKRRLDAAALAHHERPPRLPVINLNNQHTRSVLLASVAVGMVSIVLVGSAISKGVAVMESVAFYGTVCHTVMEPQHPRSSARRTASSAAPTATSATAPTGSSSPRFPAPGRWCRWPSTCSRTIPSPVHSLRPARDTCEQCHWPTRHVGDKLQVRTKSPKTKPTP